jgi:hypothetical protein
VPVIALIYLFSSLSDILPVHLFSYNQSTRPPSPKITIIAIWNPREKPASYLPVFFASVKANPLIELVFIQVDKYNVGRCHESIPHGASNIKDICFSVEEYANLHADFLCNLWGCQEKDRGLVMEKLLNTIPADGVRIYILSLLDFLSN